MVICKYVYAQISSTALGYNGPALLLVASTPAMAGSIVNWPALGNFSATHLGKHLETWGAHSRVEKAGPSTIATTIFMQTSQYPRWRWWTWPIDTLPHTSPQGMIEYQKNRSWREQYDVEYQSSKRYDLTILRTWMSATNIYILGCTFTMYISFRKSPDCLTIEKTRREDKNKINPNWLVDWCPTAYIIGLRFKSRYDQTKDIGHTETDLYILGCKSAMYSAFTNPRTVGTSYWIRPSRAPFWAWLKRIKIFRLLVLAQVTWQSNKTCNQTSRRGFASKIWKGF